MIPARPLTIAQMFDYTVTIAVERWPVFALLTLLYVACDVGLSAVERFSDELWTWWNLVPLAFVSALTSAAIVRAAGDATSEPSPGALIRGSLRIYARALAAQVFCMLAPVAMLLLPAALLSLVLLLFGRGFPPAALPLGLGSLVAAPAAPLLFVASSVAYADIILFGRRPDAAFGTALRRCIRLRPGRGWLLGLTVCAMMVAVSRAADVTTWLPWFDTDASAEVCRTLAVSTASTFWSIVSTIALFDYRARAEGTDLAAALAMQAA